MPTVTGTEDRSRARRNQKSLEERAGARRSSRLKRHFSSRPYKTQARRHCLDGKRAGMHPEGGIARERENKTERDRDMKRHQEMEKEREREREGERERETERGTGLWLCRAGVPHNLGHGESLCFDIDFAYQNDEAQQALDLSSTFGPASTNCFRWLQCTTSSATWGGHASKLSHACEARRLPEPFPVEPRVEAQ